VFTDTAAIERIGTATEHLDFSEGHSVFFAFIVLRQCPDLGLSLASEHHGQAALGKRSDRFL
jgi:hypothetical protein